MMRLLRFSCAFLMVVVFTAGCGIHSQFTSDYYRLGPDHQEIAILPVQVVMLGGKPRDMTEDDYNQALKIESLVLQQDLYGQVLLESGMMDNDIQISVQAIGKTNEMLTNAGISYLEVNQLSPRRLGEVLGVDAVVSTKLLKDHFLDRELAMAADILGDVIATSSLPWQVRQLQNRAEITSEVEINATLLDVKKEVPLWFFENRMEVHWTNDQDHVVRRINGRVADRFPYRPKHWKS